MKSAFLIFLLLGFLSVETLNAEPYLIMVDFRSAEIFVMDENGEAVANFPVALPKITPRLLPISGKVEKIILNPFWTPTLKTREAYLKKFGKELPALIHPGDPRNAMGIGKLHIAFDDPRVNRAIRIHGTNAPESIGKRVSRGCIRMHNKDFLSLAKIIENKKTFILFY